MYSIAIMLFGKDSPFDRTTSADLVFHKTLVDDQNALKWNRKNTRLEEEKNPRPILKKNIIL